ncbi:MAG: hypothetical protein COX81_03215 [Candidatus Magasanikbacteria bacterium CG_4_10_14_0_2_um_filter_37_12]|uniref:Aminoacyl-transfer RNA synthetases class-II family profile domain-containing protein n=1 Tax=Candidatus Magasanikbacteria bacterium CG_4_10_14_0_2_um_filter_37_12 TaxID=1974637 RepID=A0A2M7V770_9BACT|nr:MAG: hypothetical protein COX81_03215 [Candidatus Magasanikbacteria bacterium CG_4_10_14_0_2_um_filter_37_12]
MSQAMHIAKNKKNLLIRSQIIRLIREFFWSQDFTEVETPLIVKYPGQEPNLTPMSVEIENERGQKYFGYLHTSPEYTMKKMLSAGFGNIFSICKCFRNQESFGGLHNPEFTMVEWYQIHANMFDVMDMFDELIKNLVKKLSASNLKFEIFNFQKIERVYMRNLWQKILGVDLDDYLTREKMYELCVEKKYHVEKDASYEELFYRIFLDEIEPKLKGKNIIIHHYPAQMAALSKLSLDDPRYAKRFEVYIDGVEIANAFSELNNSEEQLKRLQDEQMKRKKIGKDVYDIDMEFIEAVGKMPKCAGIALGVDRLVQVFGDCNEIDDVLTLPMSKLFIE